MCGFGVGRAVQVGLRLSGVVGGIVGKVVEGSRAGVEAGLGLCHAGRWVKGDRKPDLADLAREALGTRLSAGLAVRNLAMPT